MKKLLEIILCLMLTQGVYSKEIEQNSIWNISDIWTNTKSEKVELKNLVGRPAIVTMVFTSCAGACPRMISNVKNALSLIDKKNAESLSVHIFSIDPKTDTPEVLKKMAIKMGVEGRFEFYTASDESVRMFANAIGFQYKKIEDGFYTHATSLFLLNEQGVVVETKTDDMTVEDFSKKIEKFMLNRHKEKK